jgi:hypothetical protein
MLSLERSGNAKALRAKSDSIRFNIQSNLLEGDVLWDNNSKHRLFLLLVPDLQTTTSIFKKVRRNT